MVPKFFTKVLQTKRQGASALLLFLFLSLQAMAALPGLHALVHPDASDPAHECAVTLLSHGQIDVSSAAETVFRNAQLVVFNAEPPRIIFISTDIRLLPGRGPPVSSALA